MKKAATSTQEQMVAVIAAPNIQRIVAKIVGTAPLVMNKFSEKAKRLMMEKMAGTKAEQTDAKSKRTKRDYEADFQGAQHKSADNWCGIPCTAFRAAMIDACRTVNMPMTVAKMSVFIVADGLDVEDGTPLVRIVAGKPERLDSAVRNATGVADIHVRPMWREWKANITIEFDGDMISAQSVANLLDRAGRQVGVGEGRPFSKKSVGQGWGTFKIIEN